MEDNYSPPPRQRLEIRALHDALYMSRLHGFSAESVLIKQLAALDYDSEDAQRLRRTVQAVREILGRQTQRRRSRSVLR